MKLTEAGKLSTVKVVVNELLQPAPLVTLYVIVEVPGLSVVTTPEVASMVATAVLLLLQTPPNVILAKVELEPLQTVESPVIGAIANVVFTVSVVEALSPQALPTGTL